MQLGKSKALRAFDQHHRRVGNVDAYFDHGRRHQDVELVVAKGAHDRVLCRRPHAPVEQA